MRRLLTALAAACVFALGASPVLGAGAIHMTEDVTGDVIDCGANSNTVTSGTLRIVLHEGLSASDNSMRRFMGSGAGGEPDQAALAAEWQEASGWGSRTPWSLPSS
jgi:hypothetical protein